ncbi:MAG: RDD family protein, partial [Rivularia sp. (in: cyanobacteria)]
MHIFRRVKFRTPESIELEFTLAGIGNRAWALLIDYHVLGLTIALFVVVWTTLSVQLTDFWISIFGTQTPLWMLAIAFFILFAI